MTLRLFHFQQWLLRMLSHNMENFEGKIIEAKHIAMLVFVVLAIMPMLGSLLGNFDQVEIFTGVFTFAISGMLTTVKISTFLYNKRRFMNIMKSFKQLYRDLNQKDPKGARIVEEANKLATLLARVYYSCVVTTASIILTRPVLKMIYSKLLGLPITREQAIPMKFPFDTMTSPAYEFVLLFTTYGNIIVVLYVAAMEGLFVAFAINLRAHFHTLQHTIENLNFGQENPIVEREIAEVADYHQELLRLCKEVNSVYACIIFAQFLMTSIQVGVVIYQLMKNLSADIALLLHLSFLGSVMLQLFMYCYGGEVIKNESLQTSVAVQLSDWSATTSKQRRSLLFIMHRAQQEMKIEAGFYEASLKSYLAICQAAMSLMALFQSIE